ncbi:Uma2 family endonuclease [Streptomyces sp. FH025]|uniref:Uma2 family endonuclease n=1 Tax=Streptomyces sp. FH025 TaxID=2815937 RepID=UPI001A9F506D|nr:Uma2 family endonuclease [Streptomyces sp. FH025]MBO1418836.1 Uma2 family endonuclease [Streptomyces sp. FH025]
MNPPSRGWTYEQLKDVDFPFEWDLIDGVVTPRPRTDFWHDQVRDSLMITLRNTRSGIFSVLGPVTALLDERNLLRPDAVVFDRTTPGLAESEFLPIGSVALVAEVVLPSTRANDRFRKPGQYAEKGIPYYWRVERGLDNLPIVHEFHRDDEKGVYLPVAQHEGVLRTSVPYPVEIDLAALVEL